MKQVTRRYFAAVAGLHPNSLRHFGTAGWNPHAKTIRALERALAKLPDGRVGTLPVKRTRAQSSVKHNRR